MECQNKAVNIKKYYFKEDQRGHLFILSEQEFIEGGAKIMSPKLEEESKLDSLNDQQVPKKRGRPRKKKNEYDQSPEESKYQQPSLKDYEVTIKQYLDEYEDVMIESLEEQKSEFYDY